MATDFGFEPIVMGDRYFISYKTEDFLRISKITHCLNQMGVPMWYDKGIEKGKEWEKQIGLNISDCKAVIMFVTREVFSHEDTYIRVEFDTAINLGKTIYAVWLDDVDKSQDVNINLLTWHTRIKKLQGVRITGKALEEAAKEIVNSFDLINNPSVTSVQSHVHEGDIITFGRYPQGTNGEIEPLLWRVLDVEDKKALLITYKLIDTIEYFKIPLIKSTWEESWLRQWMNLYFYCIAFNEEEKNRINEVLNNNFKKNLFGIKIDQPTTDKIFALSIDEVRHYFSDDTSRIAYVTPWAKQTGSFSFDSEYMPKFMQLSDGDIGTWWLRSLGNHGWKAASVDVFGKIDKRGEIMNYNYSARPALWLKLSSNV